MFFFFFYSITIEISSSNSFSSNTNTNEARFLNINCKCNKRARVKISESKSNPNRLYYCCEDNVCGIWLRWGISKKKCEVESGSNENLCNEQVVAQVLHKVDGCNSEVETREYEKREEECGEKLEEVEDKNFCLKLGVITLFFLFVVVTIRMTY